MSRSNNSEANTFLNRANSNMSNCSVASTNSNNNLVVTANSSNNLNAYSQQQSQQQPQSQTPTKQPSIIPVIDPTIKGGIIEIPFHKTLPTKGRAEWLRGLVNKELSLCCLFQRSKCMAGDKCHQVHVEPSFVAAIRAQHASVVSCCRRCRDTGSMMPAAMLFFAEYFHVSNVGIVSSAHQDSTIFEVAADQLAFTTGLAQHIQKVSVAAGVGITALPFERICRLHLKGNCKYGKDCKNIHVCCKVGEALQRASIDPPTRFASFKRSNNATPINNANTNGYHHQPRSSQHTPQQPLRTSPTPWGKPQMLPISQQRQTPQELVSSSCATSTTASTATTPVVEVQQQLLRNDSLMSMPTFSNGSMTYNNNSSISAPHPQPVVVKPIPSWSNSNTNSRSSFIPPQPMEEGSLREGSLKLTGLCFNTGKLEDDLASDGATSNRALSSRKNSQQINMEDWRNDGASTGGVSSTRSITSSFAIPQQNDSSTPMRLFHFGTQLF
jgi:hypothetical protein